MTRKTDTHGQDNAVNIEAYPGETEAETMARVMVGPYLRHGIVAKIISGKMVGDLPSEPQMDQFGKAIKANAQLAVAGDMTLASEMLSTQAQTLDAIFTEMARRSALNMGDYIKASEAYMRLALKAQANCRATLEALAKLHQPREQTVRHVHVNEGGQAIVADQFHHHGGTGENAENGKQSHATGAAGQSAALPGPDPIGQAVPITSGSGQKTMQDARRN
jgi:hypothetical protein